MSDKLHICEHCSYVYNPERGCTCRKALGVPDGFDIKAFNERPDIRDELATLKAAVRLHFASGSPETKLALLRLAGITTDDTL